MASGDGPGRPWRVLGDADGPQHAARAALQPQEPQPPVDLALRRVAERKEAGADSENEDGLSGELERRRSGDRCSRVHAFAYSLVGAMSWRSWTDVRRPSPPPPGV